MPLKILAVVGARPNFMKIAPIMWEIERRDDIDAFLVHTGQHYDERMSQQFFEELKIPRPDANLEVGSGSHAVQTAEIMRRFEPVLTKQRPDLVMVVGDVNSTLACALTAVKLGVPVAHVEAGLRSLDRSMPEEINRLLTDAISRWLFVSEPSGVVNLYQENIEKERVFFVGNVMIDTLLTSKERWSQSTVLKTLGLRRRNYAVLTLHRPANVDHAGVLERLMSAVAYLQRELPIVFPIHPRAQERMRPFVAGLSNVIVTEPLGYFDFMKVVCESRLALTDSGGLQEETTVLGVPCLTLRENTERPITVHHGTNRLIGLDPERIIAACRETLAKAMPTPCRPELWDGKASKRIIDVLTSVQDDSRTSAPRRSERETVHMVA